MRGWYLEGYLADGESLYRVPLNRFPALVGRQADLAVTLDSGNVSRRHARLEQRDGHLLLQDLGSKNGTFVNHDPVTRRCVLRPGDVLRFADVEFRLRQDNSRGEHATLPDATRTSFFSPDENSERMPVGARQLDQLLEHRLVKPLFQPIVSARDERVSGLELLGRGCHPDLSESPETLFTLAEQLGCAVELSEALREVGVAAWAGSGYAGVPLFLNTHPGELNDCARLLRSLRTLRERHARPPMILEIHERAVTDGNTLQRLNSALQELHIGLAYDDFGAGQARLLELLHVPPYAVKFDIALIRGLHKLPGNRREMIGLLVTLVKKGQTRALAEGVSHSDELAVCRQLGFDLIQGYACGRPVPLEQLAPPPDL